MRHLKTFLTFFELNWAIELQYRKNFFIRLGTQFLFVLVQVALIETYFRFTHKIGSWSKSEVFVLAGMFRLIEGSFHIFFHANLLNLPETINRGELDMYLTKPISALFLVSIAHQQWYEVSTFISGLVMLYLSLPNQTFGLWAWVILMSLTGLLSLYSLMLLICSLAFYIPRLTAMSSIWDAISKVSRFPLDVLQGISKLVFILAPLLVIATLPSQIVLGKTGLLGLVVQITGTILLFVTSYYFWFFSLRRYSSASS